MFKHFKEFFGFHDLEEIKRVRNFQKDLSKKMTVREIMEWSRNIPIRQGGLDILMERIVFELEEINKKIGNKCDK